MLNYLFIITTLITSSSFQLASSHQERGKWSCESSADSPIQANFRPGIITLDGHADDWEQVNGFDFSLLPALDPHEDDAYTGGKMTVKTLHDGSNMFFFLEVDGDFVYSQGDNNKCALVALMFQVGENASYHNMGGCEAEPDSCSNKTCRGHEVDIMHFSVGNAISGRLYGGNPLDNRDGNGGDRFGHLVDLYAWNPHCRYLDGMSPSGVLHIRSNLNPVWNESLMLSIPDPVPPLKLVTVQSMDDKLGRMVTRVVLPRVVMHSRYHYSAFSENFTGLELENGGGRGTSANVISHGGVPMG